MIKEAIILAGGLGTRLRSAVPELPKCMAPVNGIPFIDFVIAWLRNEGVTTVILSLGYKHETVIQHLDEKFPALIKKYVIEHEPLGTGGGIKLACEVVKGTDVIIVNGDTLFNVSIKELSTHHEDAKADCSLALKEMVNFSRYGAVVNNEHNEITAFNEKQFCTKGLINGGVYALKLASLRSENLPPAFSFEKDFLEKNLGTKKFSGYESDHYFIDIGIPEDYHRFEKDYQLILSKHSYIKNTSTGIGDFFAEGLFNLLD